MSFSPEALAVQVLFLWLFLLDPAPLPDTSPNPKSARLISPVPCSNRDFVFQEQPTFLGGEQVFATGAPAPDASLNPGETIRIPYSITDPNNGSLSAAKLASGYVVDRNGNNSIDPGTDLFVTADLVDPNRITMLIQPPESSESIEQTFVLPYQLILAPERAGVWFFADYTHTRAGLPSNSTTYRRYIPLTEVADGISPGNIFGVDMNQLVFQDCQGTPGVFFTTPPVNPDLMDFLWFENLDNVFDGLFTSAGREVPFTPTSDDEHYYVLARFVAGTSGTVTQRYLPLRLINFLNCQAQCSTPQEALKAVLIDASLNWPYETDILNFVGVINNICQ